MKKRLTHKILSAFFIAALLVVFGSCASVPQREGSTSSQASLQAASQAASQTPSLTSSPALEDPLPIDPQVRVGVLRNGLTYYIRRNTTPEKRAELRLVVNAGSVLEDDDQLGLAHFLEHMAFEGTKHFERQQIVDYLESIGMRYGPELNAYTSYDETVYMLQVPTDREDALPTAIHILDEWAGKITLDEREIEAERGVVIEEWRVRRDADSRIRDSHAPVLYFDSRYAEREPIGKPEIIRSFEPATLWRFYRDWYRPDLMAVIVVGDFDPGAVERLVKKHFRSMKMPKNPRPRETYPVPGHDETLYSVVTDREATDSRVSIFTKHEPVTVSTVGDYRNLLLESLFHGMLNARLEEIAQKPDAPFVSAYSGSGRFVRSKEFYVLGAQVKEGGILRGFASLLVEAERARLHGFTEPELDRRKRELLSFVESLYNDRDKLESGSLVGEYAGHYLDGETIPGIEYERELYRKYLPGITLDEVNALAGEWITEQNRVVLASSPEKEGLKVPGPDELRAVTATVGDLELEPYREELADLPLLPVVPLPGSVERESRIEELGITEWVLSNGAKVVLRPTEFKNDQVLFGAYSPGGHSLAPDRLHVAARTSAGIVAESGVGAFSAVDLQKKLAGKIAGVSPWIDELFEGMDGSAAPADLETLFQLVYLYFTQPRMDEDAYTVYKERLREQLENREASPEETFWDAVQGALTGNNPRAMPLRSGMLGSMNLEESYDFFRDRFSDAGDFTFFFVGNFEPGRIRPLVEKYLASLPSTGRDESWRDLGIRPPRGIVKATVKKGIESKSTVAIVYTGPMDWSLRGVFTLNALGDVLDIPLRETLREKAGGTYDVFSAASPSRYPVPVYRMYVGFGTSPDQVDRLVELAGQVVDELRGDGPDRVDVDKVREILRREREANLRKNEYWRNILRSYSMNGLDYRRILEYDAFLEELSVESVRNAARAYLDPGNFVQVTLYPESWDLSRMLPRAVEPAVSAVAGSGTKICNRFPR